MKLKQLLDSGGELMSFGYETIKTPYQQHINFFPEIYSDKKTKFRPLNKLSYLVSDYRSMIHWDSKINDKIFDLDVLELNWGFYSEIRKQSNTHLIDRVAFNEVIPTIYLGKTFFIGKVHKTTDPTLYLNHFNLYACSLFLLKDKAVYVPFKIEVTTSPSTQSNKRKSVQEFYNSVDQNDLLNRQVICSNMIVPNIPMKDVRPIYGDIPL